MLCLSEAFLMCRDRHSSLPGDARWSFLSQPPGSPGRAAEGCVYCLNICVVPAMQLIYSLLRMWLFRSDSCASCCWNLTAANLWYCMPLLPPAWLHALTRIFRTWCMQDVTSLFVVCNCMQYVVLGYLVLYPIMFDIPTWCTYVYSREWGCDVDPRITRC